MVNRQGLQVTPVFNAVMRKRLECLGGLTPYAQTLLAGGHSNQFVAAASLFAQSNSHANLNYEKAMHYLVQVTLSETTAAHMCDLCSVRLDCPALEMLNQPPTRASLLDPLTCAFKGHGGTQPGAKLAEVLAVSIQMDCHSKLLKMPLQALFFSFLKRN
jgi:hypothetical protein